MMEEERDLPIAERIFDGGVAQWRLEELLEKHEVPHERTGWDDYDRSLELHGVPVDYRMPEEAQRAIHAAGFGKCYVNHVDKWETHYTFYEAEFKPAKGWRVSYPHRRGNDEKGIWVEQHIPGWPQEWFDTGYVLIKP